MEKVTAMTSCFNKREQREQRDPVRSSEDFHEVKFAAIEQPHAMFTTINVVIEIRKRRR